MARRSDHSRDELKSLILDTAWDIVGKGGFDALTARAVATRIGYAPGTIYNLFESMDDLYLHVSARTLDKLYEALSNPKIDSLKAMARTYMEFARTARPYWLMLFAHQLPDGTEPPEWYREKIERPFTLLEGLLAPYFTPRQGKKRKLAARTLWAAIHGIVFLEETAKIQKADKQSSSMDMAEFLIDNFVCGFERVKT